MQPRRPISEVASDQAGQSTIEYSLLLVAFALPMIYVIRVLLAVLEEHYRLVSFLETLPYP